MSLKNFGLYFADIREKSGYKSQRELADKSGVSHSTINRIEAGTHKASPETLKALAPFLKEVSYEELLKQMGYIGFDNYELTEKLRQKAEYGLAHDQIVKYSVESNNRTNSEIDPELYDLLEKLKQKGAELQATALLRTASKMTKRQLEDILRVFEMIEKDED